MSRQVAFLFPGQGAQYIGMGKSFYEQFPKAKEVFQEADDVLNRNLSRLIFEGSEQELTETKNSQLAIFVTSTAVLRTVQELHPQLVPAVCSGLSLGEYTALLAAGKFSFSEGLLLVQDRARFMNEACEENPGAMSVVLGMSGEEVEQVVLSLNLPQDLWVANYNCPGQIVISGTKRGVEKGGEALKAKGAKRVLPLQVHGAFHSGLMASAEKKLEDSIAKVAFKSTQTPVVMNVPGDYVIEEKQIPELLRRQVTSSVKWEQGVKAMGAKGVGLFIEMGCGKVLAGLNKKIGVLADTISVETVEDLPQLEKIIG